MGSIQIPGGNEPIVLHRDAVSGEATPWSQPSSARTWTSLPAAHPAPRRGSSP
ncbi:hypothetical protein PJ267_12730 [Arthrobacter sp. OVS8]|nr:hypothetical protein PJ267_12730 [Arthrobacter sp. OVS8]